MYLMFITFINLHISMYMFIDYLLVIESAYRFISLTESDTHLNFNSLV